MDGVLVVDKPAGPTSHDVVARVRRAIGTSRIGHTGTLDPLATGVLALVVGRATRLAQLLTGVDKEYDAAIRLGLATETYDAAGRSGPPPEPPAGIDARRIEAELAPFRGTYAQAPPPYSAKKIGGVAAYKLARRNTPVQPAAVTVAVSTLSLLSYDAGLARVRLCCSAGFYVRSLAHDLGARIGCGAHLEALRRIRSGAFGIESAVPLEAVEAAGSDAVQWLIPLDELLPHVPAVVLNERGLRRASHGNDLAPGDFVLQAAGLDADAGTRRPRWRLLGEGGTLVGIAEMQPDGLLHPVVVLV